MRAALVVLGQKKQGIQVANQLIRAAQRGGIEKADCQVILLCPDIRNHDMETLACKRVICFQGIEDKIPLNVERIVYTLKNLQKKESFDIFLFLGNGYSDQLAARLGMSFGSSVATQIDWLHSEGKYVTILRDVYGCNLKAEMLLKKRPYCLSLRKMMYAKEELREIGCPQIEIRELEKGASSWELIEYQEKKQADGLDRAKIAVVGGRGIGGKAGFEKLKQLADAVGGVVGATRPAVTDGWAEREKMVGISGKIIHPDLCIAIGVSGAMPFASGIQESGKVVAINDDQDSLMFKVSDAGVVLDWRVVVDELLFQLEAREKKG